MSLLVNAFGLTAFRVVVPSALQLTAPADLLGRVRGAMAFIYAWLAAFSGAIAGTLADTIGVGAIIAAASIGLVVLGCLCIPFLLQRSNISVSSQRSRPTDGARPYVLAVLSPLRRSRHDRVIIVSGSPRRGSQSRRIAEEVAWRVANESPEWVPELIDLAEATFPVWSESL